MIQYLRLLGLTVPMLVGLSLMGYTLIPDPLIDALIQMRSARDQAGGVWS